VRISVSGDLLIQKKPMKAKHPGFTLVELLIVIAIVAVLAALLFGLASRSINSAQKAVCVSNLGVARLHQRLQHVHDVVEEPLPHRMKRWLFGKLSTRSRTHLA